MEPKQKVVPQDVHRALLKKMLLNSRKTEKQADDFIPRVYVIDKEADSVFYRGKWYYDAHNPLLIDWKSEDGDYVMKHISLDVGFTVCKSLILTDHGDTIACPGDSVIMHPDEYGDTIFFKRKTIYF